MDIFFVLVFLSVLASVSSNFAHFEKCDTLLPQEKSGGEAIAVVAGTVRGRDKPAFVNFFFARGKSGVFFYNEQFVKSRKRRKFLKLP